MKSAEYWQRRTEEVEEVLHDKGVEYYHHLEKQYREAAQKTQQEISVLYNRLAANNNISLSEANRLLNGRELKEFKWTVEEYIEKAKESTISEAWKTQLENASLRYRISRLEAMKIQMQHHAETLFASEADGLTDLLSDIYTEGFYRTGHIIQTGLGVGHSFAKLDTRRIEKVIGSPWAPDGRDFSSRIWKQHKPQLVKDLHSGLTQNIIRGESHDKLAKYIAKKYDVAANRAETLVLTESAYFGNASQQDCYKELDVELQQFCATLDTRTSEICREMDMKVIKSSDIVIGENAPPLHCRCRSVMVPYFEDDVPGERAARDADGNTIYVSGDMTYQDWCDEFVKDSSDVKKTTEPFKDRVATIKNDLTTKQKSIESKRIEFKNAQTTADMDRLAKEVVELNKGIELDYQRAGREFIDELKRTDIIGSDEMRKLQEEYREAMKLYAKTTDEAERAALWEKYNIANKKYWEVFKKKTTHNISKVKDIISQVRSVGASDVSELKSVHLGNSRSPSAKYVIDAYAAYPTDWVDASVSSGKLKIKSVKRGYYDHRNSEIAISGGDEPHLMKTAIHELGHRFERVVDDLLNLERHFYNRRTEGEYLQWLGRGYANSETSRFDKFLSPYMGKDYGGTAYEIVSMGFELAYANPRKLMEDEDMAAFIYGLLLLK